MSPRKPVRTEKQEKAYLSAVAKLRRRGATDIARKSPGAKVHKANQENA